MALRIPESDRLALATLMKLPEATIEGLVGALRSSKPALRTQGLASQVAGSSAVDPETASQVVRVLLSLFSVWTSRKVELDRFVEELQEALQATGDPQLQPASWPLFNDRLKNLLSVDRALGITSKALDVSLQHKYWLCESRIVSDVRPVFGTDAAKEPEFAVVSHVLKLVCHRGDDLKEIFVAADATALQQLRISIERALAKDKTLRRLMTRSGVGTLDTEER